MTDINTEQDFIDYMSGYGTHVCFKLGQDFIQKQIHLDAENTSYFTPNCKTTSGKELNMKFTINNVPTTFNQCLNLIRSYNRDYRLEKLGI